MCFGLPSKPMGPRSASSAEDAPQGALAPSLAAPVSNAGALPPPAAAPMQPPLPSPDPTKPQPRPPIRTGGGGRDPRMFLY